MLRTNTNHLIKLGLFGLAITLVAAPIGCQNGEDEGDDEVGETTETTGDGDGDTAEETAETTAETTAEETAETTDTGEPECATHEPGEGAAVGETCTANADCVSKVCVYYQDAPTVDGTCEETTANCETRILGRILDFETRMPVEGIELAAKQAILASGNPAGAPAEAMGTSGADGTFDFLSGKQLMAAIGLVGVAQGEGYFVTVTGLASPAQDLLYGPASTVRDVWVVPADLLTAWSGMLAPDPAFDNQLPLGEMGGVVGLVRDKTTGEPIANAKVVSQTDGSGAVIRYLNEAGDGFTEDVTSSQGIFVLVKPALAETFEVEVDGVVVDGVTVRAGSASGAVFTGIFNVP